jgi:hypothetical protein
MRMAHYYAGMALLTAPCLLLTLLTGIFRDDSQRHLLLGFTTAILCVATNTLLILFMIVSGRVLKAASRSRDLGREFLAELNEFFARRSAYPVAILSAFVATAAAVLGYGRFIGVPPAVHMLVGLTAVLLNLSSLGPGLRVLRANQALLDRATSELDRLDSLGTPVHDEGEPAWAFDASTRWCVFAVSAWAPYLYWSLVVWRGEFGRVAPLFPILTTLASALGLVQAWRTHGGARSG